MFTYYSVWSIVDRSIIAGIGKDRTKKAVYISTITFYSPSKLIEITDNRSYTDNESHCVFAGVITQAKKQSSLLDSKD